MTRIYTLFAAFFFVVGAWAQQHETPEEVIYDLALVGCSAQDKGMLENELIEMGPKAEMALHDALAKGPSEVLLATNRQRARDRYRTFYPAEKLENYSVEQKDRLHINTEEEYLTHSENRFRDRFALRMQEALGGLEYAKENRQGFWSEEVLVSEADAAFMMTAFPNPFQTGTTLQFKLSENATVNAAVYDISGQLVHELFRGTAEAGQLYSWNFEGSNLAEGVYYFRVGTPTGIHTKKLVLTK